MTWKEFKEAVDEGIGDDDKIDAIEMRANKFDICFTDTRGSRCVLEVENN